VTTPHQPADDGTPTDPYLDMRVRWCPSPTQDARAGEALTLSDHTGGAFTVQLLVGKHHGIWHTDIQILPLPGLYWSKDAAQGACTGAAATHRRLQPDVPVSASYCWHQRLASPDDPSRTDDGRTWCTHWSIHEDILAATGDGDQHD
jgi:hypothetical protein